MRHLFSFGCSLYYRFFSWVSRSDSPSALEVLGDDSLSEFSNDQLETLRFLLRRFPFWRAGHVRVAELALNYGLIEESYAACRTALLLHRGAGEDRHLKVLLYRTYLGSGNFKAVVNALTSPSHVGELSLDEREVLAAAYMASGEEDKARELLESLPTSSQGGSTEAPLQYLRGRAKVPE